MHMQVANISAASTTFHAVIRVDEWKIARLLAIV